MYGSIVRACGLNSKAVPICHASYVTLGIANGKMRNFDSERKRQRMSPKWMEENVNSRFLAWEWETEKWRKRKARKCGKTRDKNLSAGTGERDHVRIVRPSTHPTTRPAPIEAPSNAYEFLPSDTSPSPPPSWVMAFCLLAIWWCGGAWGSHVRIVTMLE